MKKRLLTICLSLLSLCAICQSGIKVFEEVKSVTLRNVGVIKQNNVIKGYYNFYEYDKVDRKTILFKLNIMDENLNVLGTKDITGPKSWELISSGFDGENFCFKFYDEKAKTFELKVYDQDAKEVLSNQLDINYKVKSSKYQMYSEMENPELNIIDNNGFVDYRFNDTNDGFFISYINGEKKKKWDKTYEPNGDFKIMTPLFLGGNDEMFLTFVNKVNKGMFNAATTNSLLALNTSNGNKIFDVATAVKGKNIVPTNVSFTGDKILLIGLFYASNYTIMSAPEGFAFVEYDKKGKVLRSSLKTFQESMGKYFSLENGKIAGDYLFYVHGIQQTSLHTNLLICEKFKKKMNGMGVAFGSKVAKLELENMILMEMDSAGTVLQAKEVSKAKGFTPLFPAYTGFFPPYLLAYVADLWGWMDYMYTLKNEDGSEITVSYIDFEKDGDEPSEKNSKAQSFGQIKYKNGSISNDKVTINNQKATFTHLYPAKSGSVLQMNYFKKEKKMTMDFIKLSGIN